VITIRHTVVTDPAHCPTASFRPSSSHVVLSKLTSELVKVHMFCTADALQDELSVNAANERL